LSEAAITAPNLSGSAIRRNMLFHDSPSKTIGAEHSRSVMRRVRHARKNLTTKQLGGFMIADSFWSLTEFCIRSSWSELVRKHNDPAIDYHVSLYVTSIPCQNNVRSLSIISKATESETVYKLSYDDLLAIQPVQDPTVQDPSQPANCCPYFTSWTSFAAFGKSAISSTYGIETGGSSQKQLGAAFFFSRVAFFNPSPTLPRRKLALPRGRRLHNGQRRQSSQRPLDFLDFVQLRVTQIIVYYKNTKLRLSYLEKD
jgi:hypothetical protein